MNSILKFTLGVLLVSLVSCNSYDILLEQNESLVLKETIESLNLDSKFNINKELYNEFIESLTFDENGKLIGAIYTGIEKELDDESSDKFWENFDISVRKKDDFKNKKKGSQREDTPLIFRGYKPKRGSCKSNSRWICVIRDSAIATEEEIFE